MHGGSEVVTARLGLVSLPRILRKCLGIISPQLWFLPMFAFCADSFALKLWHINCIMSPSPGLNIDVEALSGICG